MRAQSLQNFGNRKRVERFAPQDSYLAERLPSDGIGRSENHHAASARRCRQMRHPRIVADKGARVMGERRNDFQR